MSELESKVFCCVMAEEGHMRCPLENLLILPHISAELQRL